MSTSRRSGDCTIPLWLAGLATLALAALAYALAAGAMRTSAEHQANAALQAAGMDWAQFRVADRLGVIDGQAPDAQTAAAARVAVSQALAGKVGFPGVIATIVSAAGAQQLDLRGAMPAPAKPSAPLAAQTPTAPALPATPAPTEPKANPAPPAAAAAVAVGAPLVGAKTCEAALLQARAKRAITFVTGSAALGPTARAVLVDITAAAGRCQDVRIEIAGHTDTRGLAVTNQKLSEARANVVREALIGAGVRADAVFARGYGETRPITRGARERDHARNRRITFSVVDAN